MDDGAREGLAQARLELRKMRDALQRDDQVSAEVHSEKAIRLIDRVLGFAPPSGEEVRGG